MFQGLSRDFADLPEFRSSALNIRSPDTMNCVIYIIQTGDLKFASGDYISPVGRQKKKDHKGQM